MDQDLYRIQRAHDITRARRASGQPADAYAIYAWRTILSNFTPIRFEMTKPWAFLKSVAPTRRSTRTKTR